MNKNNHLDIFNILSVCIIVLFAALSLIRFNYLPQFIDGYYHLSCANGFIKSGGWVGIDWWNFAPGGRPHLYPPIYHFLLIFIKTIGLSGIDAVRLTEVLIVPSFLFLLWYIFKKNISSVFSFIFLLALSSFFSFYSSISGNLPASLAIIWGILSWHFLKKRRYITTTLFLILAFYTHTPMSWAFFISFLALACLNRQWRFPALLIAIVTLIFSSPLINHQLRYIEYVNLSILRETMFSHFSIFVLITGVISFFYHLKRRSFFSLLFCGYLLGSIVVFFKYPYRFFSAQGALGFVLLSSYLLREIYQKMSLKKRVFYFFIIFSYLFFFHSTIDLEEGKIRFNLLNSTYYNVASGNFMKTLEFNSLLYPRHYLPIVEVIKDNSQNFDAITSNIKISSQMFSALSDRPTSSSMLGEVRGFSEAPHYLVAKIIIWIKPKDLDLFYWQEKLNLVKLYESQLAYVFLNPFYGNNLRPIKAKIRFNVIAIAFLFFLFIFIADNVKILKVPKLD